MQQNRGSVTCSVKCARSKPVVVLVAAVLAQRKKDEEAGSKP